MIVQQKADKDNARKLSYVMDYKNNLSHRRQGREKQYDRNHSLYLMINSEKKNFPKNI